MIHGEESPGLNCRLFLPFSWRETVESGADECAQLEESNIHRLQIIQGFEESTEGFDEVPGLANEIRRLDFKLNVLLELVAQMATKELLSSPPSALTLSCDSISWNAKTCVPDVGRPIQMELYLERRFPFPIVLNGCVETVADPKDDDGDGGRAVVTRLSSQSEPMQELWDKYIFRCHRRYIAKLKRDSDKHSA